MTVLDIENWNRKELFQHFMQFKDPHFAVTIPFDVSKAYAFSKKESISFFATYLHACMRAINEIENFRYRITSEKEVIVHDVIHASPTIGRPDRTFGFSYIDFEENLEDFIKRYEAERQRVLNSTNLFPTEEKGNDCIYCSALPWFDFSAHKEPLIGNYIESVPKLAFGKVVEEKDMLRMNVAVNVNHALVDGHHVALFAKSFQRYLNETKW